MCYLFLEITYISYWFFLLANFVFKLRFLPICQLLWKLYLENWVLHFEQILLAQGIVKPENLLLLNFMNLKF